METRLQPWEPEKVLCAEDSDILFDPEALQEMYGGKSKTLLRRIAQRNLSRRVISECCSLEWRARN